MISNFSTSKRIKTPFEKPIAIISLIAHIAVMSAVSFPLVKSFPKALIIPPLLVFLSDYWYMNSQFVSSLHSKKFVSVIVALY